MNPIIYADTITGSSGINGDAYFISPDQKVFVLADGASGAGPMGKQRMSQTCTQLAMDFPYETYALDAKSYVSELFRRINARLIELSQTENQLMFGTLILAVLDQNMLTITTYGDSPAWLMQDDSIHRLARNLKRYENFIEAGHITREQYEKLYSADAFHDVELL